MEAIWICKCEFWCESWPILCTIRRINIKNNAFAIHICILKAINLTVCVYMYMLWVSEIRTSHANVYDNNAYNIYIFLISKWKYFIKAKRTVVREPKIQTHRSSAFIIAFIFFTRDISIITNKMILHLRVKRPAGWLAYKGCATRELVTNFFLLSFAGHYTPIHEFFMS